MRMQWTATFTQDCKIIAKRPGLADGLDGLELLTAVRERIEAGPCWLLLLDNADSLAVFGVGRTRSGRDQGQDTENKQSLYDFVPRGPAGTVLWTNRGKRISSSLVGGRRAINVASMTEGEARILLETVMCREIAEEESYNAMALLAELDLLPLAVSQAAAYMERTATPIGEYLSKLKRRRKRWQLVSETESDRYRRQSVSNSIMQTWDISIEHIWQENQIAYNILHSLSFVDSQNIPFNSVLLQHFSFLRLRTSGERHGAYEMHKLVQEATWYNLSQEGGRTDHWHFSEVALRAATSLFPERRRELWGECERYLRHAQLAAGWARLCRGGLEAAALLTQVWREKEPKHPGTIWSMADLATAYHAQGRYEGDEKILVEALALRRDVLGKKHPNTLQPMHDIAIAWNSRQRCPEALVIMQGYFQLQCKPPDT
ncbi:hypothetical protein QBC36DRAFT_349483 [Triangularia setosa]|uniref:Kinesin light chain n=1 Tax=Triangularia setosa TaxID=2587417 RepID=A0AAN6W079_9PEZI|nr:hypothetical protein QBC36DRAFT_349483 [Podospora setosa]